MTIHICDMCGKNLTEKEYFKIRYHVNDEKGCYEESLDDDCIDLCRDCYGQIKKFCEEIRGINMDTKIGRKNNG